MKLKIQYGYTKNMGNFESQRIDLGIEDIEVDDSDIHTINEVYTKWYTHLKTLVQNYQGDSP